MFSRRLTLLNEFNAFLGGSYVTTLKALTPLEVVPHFRVLDDNGAPLSTIRPRNFTRTIARQMLETMLKQQVLDLVMPEAQRQGRISFYMTAIAEEAACVGSVAGLSSTDTIFAQYREAAALLHRGYSLKEFMAQCFGSVDDKGKGRNMPMHFGSPEYSFQTISSPLCTQLPQAAGVGYGLKLENSTNVCLCYFGEGAASEGDFHAGLNLAATLGSRTIFFCRNNGYAISTPFYEQYTGDGIITRALGYNMPAFRVDGSDAIAVMYATEEARRICIEENRPVLIEAMCYRGGHHSTSDDSTRYRSSTEISEGVKIKNGVKKFASFLTSEGWWEPNEAENFQVKFKREVLSMLSEQEKASKHPFRIMFDDVYNTVPRHLEEQRKALEDHTTRYSTKSH